MIDIENLEKISRQIRATCVQMAHESKRGHLLSALTCVDILVALYCEWLKVSPSKPFDEYRDRFYMSKGHGVSSLYAIFAKMDFINKEELRNYSVSGSSLPDHPCKHSLPILEASSGSLGNCLGIATGALYGLRLKGNLSRAIVLMSDGECNEGSVWEAAMFAAAQKMGNLLVIIDYNGVQAVGNSDEIMGHTSLEEKFASFGWSAVTINGNNFSEILHCLNLFPLKKNKPTAIIAKTKVGISFMESNILWHYKVPSEDDLNLALSELGEIPLHKNI